jgi:deoxyribodipyrimidine photo-lyase
MEKISIIWFRRDLRLEDNAALSYALKENKNVLPIFIFDSEILEKLSDKKDRRVEFIFDSLLKMKSELNKHNSDLLVLHGKPNEIWSKLSSEYAIEAVYTNTDYEPYARNRDKEVENTLESKAINFKTYKDHCIFDYTEVLKDDGKPYTVYTPYSKKWKSFIKDDTFNAFPCAANFGHFMQNVKFEMPSMAKLGFEKTDVPFPKDTVNSSLIQKYAETRNFPALDATSKLSLHFRFGTISIRDKAKKALTLSETWLNELIWRDFYMQIMAHFPHAMKGAFKPVYDRIEWRNNADEFNAWCEGKTGYPIVDAGMRELNASGFMHNRVRMVVASFLCKHLLIDWRWGEAYFAQKLLDFELASNNGGWQWAAGSGVDAAPYFRIFSPKLQTERFDPKLEYIKKWIPELNTLEYPRPIVDHDFARKRCLEVYKKTLNETK